MVWNMKLSLLAVTVFLSAGLTACGGDSGGSDSASASDLESKAIDLGETLFHDTNLSLDRTQSCATCHDPDHAFTDPSTNGSGNVRSASVGDDGVSLGDRNTPTAMYSASIPEFTYGTHQRFNSPREDYVGYIGGQFWDGRAATLEDQAGGPPLNPVEMNMPDKATVVARLRENVSYEESFTELFGANIFDDIDQAYVAMTQAIAAFERSADMSPFNSKYDKFLRGEYEYSPVSKAALGKARFFSQQFTNCATCHQLRPNGNEGETFSNYEFHNIGVPVNTGLRTANGSDEGFTDTGLANIDAVSDEPDTSELEGKFRVPTLRNVGVTAPYMHNGVFQSLDTVIRFYDRHLTNSTNGINPETGVAWAAPEVAANVSFPELRQGTALSENDIEGLVCFLYSLTDEQYEHLLPEDAEECGL
jgi:cytochrome c peroxidase